ADDVVAITTTDMKVDTDLTTVTADMAKIGDATTEPDADAIATVIDNLDTALDKVNSERAKYGAAQNRFESVIANLQVAVENQAAARGRIMDTDFAAETANLSRAQVLQQAGMAMLSPANAVPQNVLSLLRWSVEDRRNARRADALEGPWRARRTVRGLRPAPIRAGRSPFICRSSAPLEGRLPVIGPSPSFRPDSPDGHDQRKQQPRRP